MTESCKVSTTIADRQRELLRPGWGSLLSPGLLNPDPHCRRAPSSGLTPGSREKGPAVWLPGHLVHEVIFSGYGR